MSKEKGVQNTSIPLEKARYNAKTCYRLLNDLGQEIKDPQMILEEQKQFYQKLYQQDKDVNFSMENIFGVKVSEKNKRTTRKNNLY